MGGFLHVWRGGGKPRRMATANTRTASKGIKIADDNNIQYLKDATKAVRLALDDFRDDERYDQIYTIINLFYFKRSHTIEGAAMEANYSKRQATRIKNLFVKTVMIYLGWALPN